MSTMRKITRGMARSQSYKKTGTTNMFHYFFEKTWREKAGHPVNKHAHNSPSATKKGHVPKFD